MQKHGRTIASDMMRLPLAFDIECIEQNQLESFDYVAIKRCERMQNFEYLSPLENDS